MFPRLAHAAFMEKSHASGLVNGSMELAKLIEGEVHPEVASVSKR